MSDGYQATKAILEDPQSIQELINVVSVAKDMWKQVLEEQQVKPYRLAVLLATMTEIRDSFAAISAMTDTTLKTLQGLQGETANV